LKAWINNFNNGDNEIDKIVYKLYERGNCVSSGGKEMEKKTAIKLFETKQVRSAWNLDGEKWYFSIVNVVGILTDSPNPNNYWKVLKHRLKKEGSELVTNCNQLIGAQYAR
jgi:hypothetical protein